MGNRESIPTGRSLSASPLVRQRGFEATIHRRFVSSKVETLEFEDQFWNKPQDKHVEIREAARGKLLFKVPPLQAGGTNSRRLLLDAYGVPVVGMEQHIVLPVDTKCTEFAVFAGGQRTSKELFRFETRFNPFFHQFTLMLKGDYDSKDRARVVVVGKNQWLARRAEIAIQRGGRNGKMQTIARQVPVDDVRDGKYRIAVAPGVDLSLVVLFAAAMDETNHRHQSSLDKQNVEYEARRYARGIQQKRHEKNVIVG